MGGCERLTLHNVRNAAVEVGVVSLQPEWTSGLKIRWLLMVHKYMITCVGQISAAFPHTVEKQFCELLEVIRDLRVVAL